uniref:Bulb-type lectin domain-containing protein n=2 Tax=Takifugu rubripes TaxID=31033 RepID=A0A3B5K1C1_TAKRU
MYLYFSSLMPFKTWATFQTISYPPLINVFLQFWTIKEVLAALTSLILLLLLAVWFGCYTKATTMSVTVLENGSELKRGDSVLSKNSQWIALFQQDGNFVVYRTEPVWASDTFGMDPTRLCMQEDCNLVMYNDEDKPRWHTNTSKGGRNTCVLSLTDEGKLVLKKDCQQLWNSDRDHGMK